ncbi:hypothetical protein B1690_03305 [Geobacillus sp. 46C-IIa]|nr:hypothetical protein B1690_03305 [Geobacillus sp. 46C-IIa]OQP16175.1 hypothetical protein B1693_09780 [Geobacillus zalihae]
MEKDKDFVEDTEDVFTDMSIWKRKSRFLKMRKAASNHGDELICSIVSVVCGLKKGFLKQFHRMSRIGIKEQQEK